MNEKLQVQKNASAPSQMAPSPQFQERPFTDERYQPTTSKTTILADSPPNIARPSFNLMNMSIFAPTPAANIDHTGIQRQEEEEKQENLQLTENMDSASASGEGEDENNQDIQLKEESDAVYPAEGKEEKTQDIQLKAQLDRASSEEGEEGNEQNVQLKAESNDASPQQSPPEDIELKSVQTKLNIDKSGNKYEHEQEQEIAPQATEALQMKEESKSLLGHVGDFGTGLYEGGKDTVTGLGSMAKGAWNLTGGWATNPEEAKSTWDNFKSITETVVENPGVVWEGIKEPYVKAWQEGRPGEAFGRGTFEALSIILGGKGLDKLAKGSKLATNLAKGGKATKASEAAKTTNKVKKIPKSLKKANKDPYAWNKVREKLNGGSGKAPWRANENFPMGKEYQELSHWLIPHKGWGEKVPNRFKNREWNLKRMWGKDHALADPERYQFMPEVWKNTNPLPNPLSRFWNRTPEWAQGTMQLPSAAGTAGRIYQDIPTGEDSKKLQRQLEDVEKKDDTQLGQKSDLRLKSDSTIEPPEMEEKIQQNSQCQSIQPKLTVGKPGDKYEQEADSMAAKVMSMSDSAIQRQTDSQTDEQKEEVRTSPLANSISRLVQRQTAENSEELQMKPGLQRSQNGSSQASPSIESRLSNSKGGGSPLPDEVRSFMEPRFGADFSSVRVHTDSTAVQMNKDLGAQAFAHGSDIYYGAGKSPGKNELTAHELTHTVQQGGAVRLNKEVWRKPQLEQEEKEAVQAKEITNKTNQLSLNKELRLKVNQEPETKTIEAKEFTPQTSEITENKQHHSDTLPEKTEQKPLEAKQFTDINKDSDRKQTPNSPKSSETTVETTPQKTQSTVTETAPKITDAKDATETKPKPTEAENSPKPSTEALAQQPPHQGIPTPQNQPLNAKDAAEGKPKPTEAENTPKSGTEAVAQQVPPTPQKQPPNGKTPEAAAEKALEPNPNKQNNQAAAPGTTPPAPGAEAAPAMDSGGGAGDAGGEMEGGQSETDPDIEAAAASNEKVELDPSETDAAMANLAEGGGGEAPTGGGGGGAAITEKPAPPVPDVSGADPSAALASVSNLPPAQLLTGLGSVGTAVGNTVGKERAELAANPPQMESPSASPNTGEKSAADKDLPAGKTPKAVEKTPEGQTKPIPQPKPIPLPPPPTAAVRQPQVKGDEQGKLSEGDVRNLQASLSSIPTRDRSLQNVSAGAPPQVELQGNADPQRAQEQKAKLEKGLTEAHNQGKQDLAQPMGENQISPKVPKETLRAEGIGGGGAGGAVTVGGGAAGGMAGDEAISIIAQQEQGQQIQSAVAQAQAQMTAKRQEHTAQVAEEKAKSNKDIAKLQQDNAVEQEAERAKAQTDIGQQRSQWQKEQDNLITKSRQDADAAISKVGKEVSQEQTKAESKAAEHIKAGEEKAAEERRKGEEKAEAERKKGEQESGGIFGWLADKAKAFFDGIKQAIHAALDAARAAVKAAIEGAQKLATAVIETARQAIVGIIKLAGEALIAIGDVMLAAFPEMRERYRNAMKAIVRTAENAVNAIANNLKKGVQTALNLLGKGLDFALGLMEKGLMAAVDIASIAVQGAIQTAKAAVEALGAFAVLAKDIASGPGQWLSNLGAGAKDGVRNHLWGAFQTAVKEWFNQKVEEVLGLGMTVWKVLSQGGIKTAEVGKMAWEGIKSAIPPALIQILIEKVISMIVPAAGAVLAIIEGLQAAWGTVSRVIQAFDRFMAFLKAVKTGRSGPQFGAALAAAGVVLIDFVSNWLLKRVRGAASKVAAKIKEIAQKIGRKLKAATKKLGRKFGKLKDKYFGKKGNKGDKGKGKEGEDEDKKKQAKKRLRKAAKEIDRALAKGKPEKEARTAIDRIAGANKVQANLTHSGKGWKLKLKVNPEIDRFFKGEDLQAIKSLLHDLNKSSKNAAEVIASAIRNLRNVKGLTPRQAREEWQKDVDAAGGSTAYIEQLVNEGKIKDRAVGSGSVLGYTERQDIINENLAKQYADPSSRVVHLPGGRGSGHDTTLIYLDERRVEALEIKKGGLKGLDVTGRSAVPKTKTPVPLDSKEGSGNEALRHLDKPSTPQGKDRRADELVSGGVLEKEREDGEKRIFENKVSSISENLEINLKATLEKLKADRVKLTGEMGTTSDQKVKNKLKAVLANIEEAIDILNDIISGASGKLQLIVALEPGAKASEDQIEVVNRLLEAGKRKFHNNQGEQKTAISHAIQEIDNEGNVVKSR